MVIYFKPSNLWYVSLKMQQKDDIQKLKEKKIPTMG